MAIPELGVKRLCGGCGAKYYDLNRSPAVCPKCNAVFDLYESHESPEAKSDLKPIDDDESDTVSGFVALDDDNEEDTVDDDEAEAANDIEIPDIDEDIEIGGEDTFLEADDDEDSSNVTVIIGDVPKSDEVEL